VIKILITEIYSFESQVYNPHRISISGLAYLSVPLLLTGEIYEEVPLSVFHTSPLKLAPK
jgi:hypothetical protein